MPIKGISCIFPVLDIIKTENFYVNKLGFKSVKYLECKEPHICLYKDNIEIILLNASSKVKPNRELYGYGYDAYLYANDTKLLEDEFNSKEVKIIKPLYFTDYQNQEFVIEDCDGRWLAFGLKEK